MDTWELRGENGVACSAVPRDEDRVRVCIWRLEQKKK